MSDLVNVIGIEKVTEKFKEKVILIAANLKTDPNFLMAIMSFETGGSFDPAKRNRFTNATGLIQFMPATARGLGTSINELAKMTPLRQLDFVEMYLTPFKGRMKTLEDAYMAVLLPSAIGKGENHILFKKPSTAYRQNSGLDLNGDGAITVREAAERVRRRLGAPAQPPAIGTVPVTVLPTSLLELSKGMKSREVEILQDELVGMGYMTLDEKLTGPGTFGDKTERSLKAFQRDAELAETGIYDTPTQAAIQQLNNGVKFGGEGGIILSMQKRLVTAGNLTQAELNTGPGTFGTQTQRALMQFQLDHNIQPSGVLTDETYKALYQTLPILPLKVPRGGNPAVNTVLPSSGTGYTVYHREPGGVDQVGTALAIRALQDLAAAWALVHPTVLLQYGDISRPGGGRFFNAQNRNISDHEDHREGRACDIRPISKGGALIPTDINNPTYDAALTKELVLLIKQKFPRAGILFNDPKLIALNLTTFHKKHHHHLHVTFR